MAVDNADSPWFIGKGAYNMVYYAPVSGFYSLLMGRNEVDNITENWQNMWFLYSMSIYFVKLPVISADKFVRKFLL